MTEAPRYLRLAEHFRRLILQGVYATGALLPTEQDICAEQGVSRHTARDALRVLIDEGLVERRQGAGTRVLPRTLKPAFVQNLGGPAELMQYARDARLKVQGSVVRRLTEEEAVLLGETPDWDWLVLDGLRVAGDQTVAVTRLYLAGDYLQLRFDIETFPGAIHELVAQRYGQTIGRATQRITAETLDPKAAQRLVAEPGSAALRTLRRYYGEDHGRLIVASDSLHPADRFVMEMSYSRDG